MRVIHLRRIIIFLFFLTSIIQTGFSQGDAEKNLLKESLKTAFKNFAGDEPTVIGELIIESDANGGKKFSGPLNVFGKNELKLTGVASSSYKPARLRIDFPASAVLNFNTIDAMAGGSLKAYIPAGFPVDAGINIRYLEVDIDSTGYIPKKISSSFGGNRPFGLLDDGVLTVNSSEIEFFIENPKSAQRKITGNLKGGILMGGTKIDLGTVLSNNKEDIKFTGTINNLTLDNLLKAVGATSIINTIPSSLAALGLTALNFEIRPFQKTFSVSAQSGVGEIELRMSPGKAGGKVQFLIGIAPPASFKFSSIDNSLGLLDGINLSGTALVISGYDGEMESSLKSLQNTSAKKLVTGLNVFTHINLGDELGKFLGKPDLDLYGSVDKSLNCAMTAALNFDNLKLAEGFYFKEVGFGLGFRPSGGKVNFSLNGRLEALIKGDLLSFNAGFDFSPTDVQLSAYFLMEALKKANAKLAVATKNANNEIEPPEWNEPFGVKGFGLRQLGFSLGISPKSPIFLSSIGITAGARLGINPDFAKNISGSFTANLDIANPFNSMLDIKLQNLTIIGMVDAFKPDAKISGTLRSWLDWGLEDAYLRIVPETKNYLPDNKQYERGILAGGKLKMGGLSAAAELAISETSFGFKAMVDPIDISSGGFTWFALKGYEQGNKAQMSLQLNTSDPEMMMDGSVTVLGITAKTTIKVNSKGAKFKVAGDAVNGALSGSFEVEAQQLSATSGFKVKAEFNNKLQTMVAQQLIDFIKKESAKSQAAYTNAQSSLQRAKNAAGNDAEKGFIDAANGFVSAFKEIDKGMAVAGQYVVKGLIQDAINIKRIYFESNLNMNQFTVVASIDMTIAGQNITQTATINLNISSMTAMAEKIVTQIGGAVIAAFETVGSTIEQGWTSFVADADKFFSNAGKGFAVIGKEFEKAGAVAVNWIQGAAQTIYNWGDETFNGQRVVAPATGTAPSMIPYNVTKYKVTITGVRVDRIPSTNLGITTHYPDGNELEIFGSVTIIPRGQMWTNTNSNMYGINLRQGDHMPIARGTTRTLSNSKYFYANDADISRSGVSIYTHLYDSDDQNIFTSAFVANEEMKNTSSVNFSSLQYGQTTNGQISATNREGDHGVTVFYTVTVEAKISPSEMQNAINSRNSSIVESTIRRGGNPFSPGFMQAAITNHDAATCRVLSKYGVPVTATDMNLAMTNTPGMMETLISLGGAAGRNELLKAVEIKNSSLVQLIAGKGVPADAAIVRKAIENKDKNIVRLLTQKGVLLGQPELQLAFSQADAEMIAIILNNGATPTQEMLNEAVRKKQDAITQVLVKKITPGPVALQEAANNNNTGIFNLLVSSGGTLGNTDPVYKAIDFNNVEIVSLGLRNGGDPTAALRYATQKANVAMVLTCLDNRADPSAAVPYAVKTNNQALVNDLLGKYKVNPNDCMREAILNNNMTVASTALNTGKINSNLFMALAADKNNTALVKTLTSAGGNPNLSMPAAVRLKNTELVSYLIVNGAQARNDNYIRQAVRNNSADILKILVSNGADVNAGMPVAIETRNAVMVKYLLDNGARPYGYLSSPSAEGNIEIVKLLLDKGALPDEGMASGVNGNHTAVVKLLLIAGAKPQNYIAIAATKNNAEMVADFLRSDANPDPGMRPAVDGNFTPIVKMLLDKGASGKGYVQKPSSIGNYEMVKMLLEKNGNPNEGIEAAINGNHTAVIKLLIEKGANGNRLIATPTGFGNLEIVQLLLSKGANPELGIRVAVDKGHAAITEALIKAGADGSKKEYMNITVSKKFSLLVPVLVKAGNKVDSTVIDIKGRTYLHNAAELDNSLEIIKALLEVGSSVYARDNDGNTPLHLAVDEGKDDIETVRALLDAGSDPCAENNKKRNIFKEARGTKVKKLIKDYGGSRKCS